MKTLLSPRLRRLFVYYTALLAHCAPLSATLFYESTDLLEMKKHVFNKDPAFHTAALNLIQEADISLKNKAVSVMDKTTLPPSNSKHDYMSLATYWWPNPDTINGLPYIRKDGKSNPATQSIEFDINNMCKMTRDCINLSWAYFLTSNEIYAQEAIIKMKVWFLNPQTSMNPNLNYAQGIPGVNFGRPEGIIDTTSFPELFDSFFFLHQSPFWTQELDHSLKTWAAHYLKWLLTSPNGIKEAKTKNNHATWYDFQVIYFSLYIDQPEQARKHLLERTQPKLNNHFTTEGEQPQELKRTRPFHYCTFNLLGLFYCARLGERVGVNLWETSNETPTLQKGLDWFLPYIKNEKEWDKSDLESLNVQKIAPLLLMASTAYQESYYRELYEVIMKENSLQERLRLFFPGAFLSSINP